MTKPWLAENTNDPRLNSILALLPFLAYDSGSRKQMYSSHIGQALTILGGSERYILSGAEEDFSRYVFSTKFKKNSDIIATVPLYPKTPLDSSEFVNPLVTVIFEDSETKEVGMLNITPYSKKHRHFGHRNKKCKGLGSLVKGATVPAGLVLDTSPAVGEDGSYKFGREFNTAYISIPGVAEDGVVISRSALQKLKFHRYETRTISWGKNKTALPIYGNGKYFPDIGELVRDDGLLMALREVDDDLIVCDQSNASLEEIDYVTDQRTYVMPNNQTEDMRDSHLRNYGKGRVVDIKIWYNGNPTALKPETQRESERQLTRYETARREYYRSVFREYMRMYRRRPNMRITPEFSQLIVEAESVIGHEKEFSPSGSGKDELRRHRKRVPLDVWEVELTVEYVVTPTYGFKLTDLHGGK